MNEVDEKWTAWAKEEVDRVNRTTDIDAKADKPEPPKDWEAWVKREEARLKADEARADAK